MNSAPIKELLKFALDQKDPLAKDIAIIALRYYSHDSNLVKISQEVLSEKLTIDLWELDSLVKNERYEFPDPEVEKIEVDLDE